jgi:hypothetical protein
VLQFDAGMDDLHLLFSQFGWPVATEYYQQLWASCNANELPVRLDAVIN